MGTQLPPKGHSSPTPNFRSMSIEAKRLDRSRVKTPLGTEVGLDQGHIVLDGASPTERGTAAPTFRLVSIAGKRSPISAIAQLLYSEV